MSNVGIDIGGTKMLVSYIKNKKLISKSYQTGKNISFTKILNNYNSFVQEFNLEVKSLVIAIPGLIKNNIVTACDVVPSLEGKKPTDFSANYPVAFINDVEAALIEEKSNNETAKNLIVIMIGTGIGMSMIVDGKECKGASGFTGELGYTTVNTEEGPTYLDNISAGAGILSRFNGNVEELKIALENNDVSAIKILDEATKYMGMALANVISLFNPEIVVIGGGTAGYKGYFDNLKKYVNKFTLPVLLEPTEIKQTTNPGYTAVNGAIKKAENLIKELY